MPLSEPVGNTVLARCTAPRRTAPCTQVSRAAHAAPVLERVPKLKHTWRDASYLSAPANGFALKRGHRREPAKPATVGDRRFERNVSRECEDTFTSRSRAFLHAASDRFHLKRFALISILPLSGTRRRAQCHLAAKRLCVPHCTRAPAKASD